MAQFTYKHAPNKSAKKDKPIVLFIIFSRTVRRAIRTNIYVSEQQWDKENERVVNHPGAALINVELAKQKKALQELEVSAIHAGQKFTPEYLDAVLHPERAATGQSGSEACFSDYMYKAVARQTALKYSTAKDQLKTATRFARYFPKLLFKDFNYNTLVEFERRCQQDGQARSTIAKHHKNIKKYISLAAKEGVYAYPAGRHPYENFKVKRIQGTRDFLSQKELEALESAIIPAQLEKYRKMFLFICYTGLRISDFERLGPEMLQEDVLVLKPIKTELSSGKEVHLPLKVLFGGKPYRLWASENFDFPTHAIGFRNRFNQQLKLVAMHAGIRKTLTAHVGRHTFLTHIAMKTGNVFTVMSLGGLSKVDTAMVYIHLAEQDNKHLLDGVKW